MFGQIVPKTHELLDLTYVSVDEPGLEELVDAKAEACLRAAKSGTRPTTPGVGGGSGGGGGGGGGGGTGQIGGTSHTMAQLVVEFYEKKTRKAWFGRSEEEVVWEQWALQIPLLPAVSRRSDREGLEIQGTMRTGLERALLRIIALVNERNEGYLPPILTNESNPFPYQIFVPGAKDEVWQTVFRRMDVDGH